MDKRDNYFETRIRAAQAQINQRSGSFSLSQDLVFRAGAQLMVGSAAGSTGTQNLLGEDAQLQSTAGVVVRTTLVFQVHLRPTAKDVREQHRILWWLVNRLALQG